MPAESGKALITEITKCRVCGSSRLTPIMSLGEMYTSNFVENENDKVYKGPLDLVLCDVKDGGCGLLQLKHTLDHDVLYRKYWYKSSISSTMVKILQGLVKQVERTVKLEKGDIVIDIGANDGTTLKQYKAEGITRIGFEPSNLWQLGTAAGLTVIHDYFNYEAFAKEVGPVKHAKVITSIAMFYDLEDPNRFVSDIKKCLDKNGLWMIQMGYLGTTIDNNIFDSICHEHLEYYSLFSLENLLKRHDMQVIDVEENDVNGGSFKILITNKGSALKPTPEAEARITAMREKEAVAGFDDKEVYEDFNKRIVKIKDDLLTFLNSEKKAGKKLFIYGASTRGQVVLQYAHIDNKLIEGAGDMNSDKWGKKIVGLGIPVMSPEDMRKRKPDYLLVLPYQFIDEITLQEKDLILNNGTKLIVTIPRFRIIDANDVRRLEAKAKTQK